MFSHILEPRSKSVQSFYAGRAGVWFRGWHVCCYVLPPTSWKSTKVLIAHLHLPAYQVNAPLPFGVTLLQFSLRLHPGAPNFSRPHTLDFCIFLEVQNAWQICSGNTVPKAVLSRGKFNVFFPLSPWFLLNYILQWCLIPLIISGKDSLLNLFRFKYKIIFRFRTYSENCQVQYLYMSVPSRDR